MGVIKFLIVILIISAIVGLGYYAYTAYPDAVNNVVQKFGVTNYNSNIPKEVNATNELLQFIPNMRFKTGHITYYIQDNCDDSKKLRFLKALSTIDEQTEVLSFYESINESADIVVSCSKNANQENKNEFVAGEGGPTKYLDLSFYPLILRGDVILYKTDDCDRPITELHELFHVFGFEHINNSKLIMYPYINCEQEINSNLTTKLKELYSIPNLPEIYFENVSAQAVNGYINFTMDVLNQGLDDARNPILEVYVDGKNIDEEYLETIVVGTGQKFSMKNLKLPSNSVTNIKFNLVLSQEEYNKDNNLIELKI